MEKVKLCFFKGIYHSNRKFIFFAGPETSKEVEKNIPPKQEISSQNPQELSDTTKKEGNKIFKSADKAAMELMSEDEVNKQLVEIFNNRDFPICALQNKIQEAEANSDTDPKLQEKLKAAEEALGIKAETTHQYQPGTELARRYSKLWSDTFKVEKDTAKVGDAIKKGQASTIKSQLDTFAKTIISTYDIVFGSGSGKKKFDEAKTEANKEGN